jgi:hypothetical protein
MKNLQYPLFAIILSLFIVSCGGSNSSKSSSTTSGSSDPCDDMRSYNAGVEYGEGDAGGAKVTGKLSSCDGVLKYYNDNYKRDCFCKGFYKGQSEG